jgi:hypothetical protein
MRSCLGSLSSQDEHQVACRGGKTTVNDALISQRSVDAPGLGELAQQAAPSPFETRGPPSGKRGQRRKGFRKASSKRKVRLATDCPGDAHRPG